MSEALAAERRRRAGWILAGAGGLALLSWIVTSLDLDRLKPPSAAGLVLPDFAKSAASASTITITTKQTTYHIARTERGWALRDRGDFPVPRDRLAEFTSGLESLSYLRPMTRDPGKLDRLGLGDPAKGGEGVLVQVQNAQGALLANLLLGIEPTGLYMRAPDKAQAWAVKGDLPPLKDPAAWLDLAPLSIDRQRIARVLVEPASGPSYALARDGADARDFEFEKPYDKYLVLTPAGVDAAGAAFAALRPVDVAGAPAIAGAARARVTMRTFDGLVIVGELFEQGGVHWLKLVARSESPAAAAEAQAINAKAAPWAYALSELDDQDIAPPLSALARAPGAPQPGAPPL
jgi:hypothetical protein